VSEQAAGEPTSAGVPPVPLTTIAREWGRIGCIGFGGPPAHIALLRALCVGDRHWLPPDDFEDGLAACNLLPGPASTQLAIFCAWRLRGALGAILGGVCFIVPGLLIILGLAALFLAPRPPGWITGAAAGAGAAVPAVAVAAAVGLIPASWRRAAGGSNRRIRATQGRWIAYLVAGGVAAATVGPWLVIVLAACGLAEVTARTRPRFRRPGPGPGSSGPGSPGPGSPGPGSPGPGSPGPGSPGPGSSGPGSPGPGSSGSKPSGLGAVVLPLAAAVPAAAGLLAVAWEGFKVGALSYGGGFVIIPLMQHDAVHTYHWMTAGQFLSAVALGQVTPGPVVQTVAVVGYAAAGVGGGLLAALVAFAPSFLFVLGGGRYFDRLRASPAVQAFLTGAGPAAIGAIAGAAVPLALALAHLWQLGVLVLAAAWLLGVRRGVVSAILGAAGLGVLAFAAGAPMG
jgi:chromate transporter